LPVTSTRSPIGRESRTIVIGSPVLSLPNALYPPSVEPSVGSTPAPALPGGGPWRPTSRASQRYCCSSSTDAPRTVKSVPASATFVRASMGARRRNVSPPGT
jgi:hypothetical protein